MKPYTAIFSLVAALTSPVIAENVENWKKIPRGKADSACEISGKGTDINLPPEDPGTLIPRKWTGDYKFVGVITNFWNVNNEYGVISVRFPESRSPAKRGIIGDRRVSINVYPQELVTIVDQNTNTPTKATITVSFNTKEYSGNNPLTCSDKIPDGLTYRIESIGIGSTDIIYSAPR